MLQDHNTYEAYMERRQVEIKLESAEKKLSHLREYLENQFQEMEEAKEDELKGRYTKHSYQVADIVTQRITHLYRYGLREPYPAQRRLAE